MRRWFLIARYLTIQFGRVLGEVGLYCLCLLGLALLMKYLGRAMILVVPIVVLIFGVSLWAWWKQRNKRKNKNNKE